MEGIVEIKADYPLAAPKMAIPEEPEGLRAHFKRTWATGDPVMLQISDGSLPESLTILISGCGLTASVMLLFSILSFDWTVLAQLDFYS